jgi:hypothetical protein
MAKGHDKDLKEGEAGVQVVGYLGRLVGAPRVLPWAPADEAVVDARPPLPEAALRGGAWTTAPQDFAKPTPLPPEGPDESAAAEAREAANDLSAKTTDARAAAAELAARMAEARELAARAEQPDVAGSASPAELTHAQADGAGPEAGVDREGVAAASPRLETPHDIVLSRFATDGA